MLHRYDKKTKMTRLKSIKVNKRDINMIKLNTTKTNLIKNPSLKLHFDNIDKFVNFKNPNYTLL